ncbi:lithostathine-like [Paroedura picta]|uniref:lithostathine-like n=1 Tax=Paroedura picta TaxID=143630 RepID=UPI004056C12A
MGQAVYLGLCLLAGLLLSPFVEGDEDVTEAPAARARCPSNTFYYKYFCYEFIYNYVSWEEAESPELKRTLLVRVQSRERTAKPERAADTLNEGLVTNWGWSDGYVFTPPLWDGRKLVDSENLCVCLNRNTRTWEQQLCSNSLPYICKFKADY